MVVAGLDIGSVFSRAVIMEENAVVSTTLRLTGGDFKKTVGDLLRDIRPPDRFDGFDIDIMGACGLGASFIDRPFTKIAELPCLSRGIHFISGLPQSELTLAGMISRVSHLCVLSKLFYNYMNVYYAQHHSLIIDDRHVINTVCKLSI
jgi:hypothetical protein